MARNITITFEDGTIHVYQNAPDDLTPAAVQQRAQQDFGKNVIGVDGGKKGAPASEGMPAARAAAAPAVEAEQPAGYNPFATAGSFFPSLYKNTVGNLVDVVSSPVQSAQDIGDIVAGGVYKALPGPVQRGLTAIETSPYNPLGNPAALQRAQAMASAAGQEFVRPYSSSAEFQKTMEQDPFRPISDVSALLSSGGAALRAVNMGGRTAAVANAMVQAGDVINPINMLTRPAAAMISPTVDPGVRALMAEGVTPTTGQILGGGYKRFEEGLTSIPVIGDYIKSAQGRAVEQLSTAAFNRALKPIGSSLPSGTTGREAVQFVSDKLDDAYGKLLPKMKVMQDTPFQTEIANLRNMVDGGAINQASKDFFNKWIDGNVLNKFQGQGVITGQTLKQVQSDLRETINRLGVSTDADQRLIGDALKEAQDQVRQLVIRNNPQFSKELKAIDTGYANFKRVEKAAALTGAEEGVFSPAQLQSAVRAMDKSKDKSRFATGQALMQDLSETGKTVLGNKLPDSGTPYRSLAALIASGGAAGAGYPVIAGGLLAGPALYSAPGQRLAAAALTARPAGAAAVANQLRANQGIKTGTLAANQLANQQQSAFEEFLRANAAVDPRFQQALQAGR
jgi:hypothetical protein